MVECPPMRRINAGSVTLKGDTRVISHWQIIPRGPRAASLVIECPNCKRPFIAANSFGNQNTGLADGTQSIAHAFGTFAHSVICTWCFQFNEHIRLCNWFGFFEPPQNMEDDQ